MQELAAKLGVAIPTSFFERDGPPLLQHAGDGRARRRNHGDLSQEPYPRRAGLRGKYYFRPGNDGFKVWDVFGARIGVGICWDQWYPECARVMALKGAEVLFYPTAIGSEPYDADLDTSRMWRRAMIGHAVSNCMPVCAANRIGHEGPADRQQSFYGHSFISDEWGDLVSQFGADQEGVLLATLDLERAKKHRAGMGFRDRRPQLYGRIAEDI